jgi:sec-independent protein translocase protein TatB
MMVMLVLALVVVGPRDLPRLLKIVGGWVRQVRAVAFDFQRQFDAMSRDMEIEELRQKVETLESNPAPETPKRHIGHDMSPDDGDDDLTGLPQSAVAETADQPASEPVPEPADAVTAGGPVEGGGRA